MNFILEFLIYNDINLNYILLSFSLEGEISIMKLLTIEY